jgi:very-short-patch-repair endonuclease
MTGLKKIVNRQEEVAYRELQELARQYGYDVHVKIRLADVLRIEGSGIEDALYRFALQSHFDFLICDENQDPLFAVEFDGPSHREQVQEARDAKKDALCARFDLPLLRINTNHLLKKYNKASLLQWIISAWELQKAFEAAQAQGQIPAEEDFDPIMLWHSGKTLEEVHPHWIALRPRLHIEKLHKEGRLPVGHACSLTFTDDCDNYRGIEWIDVAADQVVCVESAMREQRFPLYLGDLFREVLTVLLYDKLLDFLATGGGAVAPTSVSARLQVMKQRYRFAGSFSAPTAVNFSISSADWLDPILRNKLGPGTAQ